ncbi:hypothetical protein HID58_005807 [Brassica napus]|uniref:Uncharacterized protein n=1 Tax=Brassica napus TaxID=3708 RepID=A0ABQ8ECI2_BRANA|nr:hypothetical protein HID58_005807 [Brassica napus]
MKEEMYVMSAKNKRVSIQLLGGDKIQELNSASLPFLEAEHFLTLLVSFASSVPDLKLLDLTGNLISVWENTNKTPTTFMIDHLFLAFRKWVLFDFVNSMSRMVMSKLNDKPEEIELLHPALEAMVTTCAAITLKCVRPSMGEKPPLTDKLPGSTTSSIILVPFLLLSSPKELIFSSSSPSLSSLLESPPLPLATPLPAIAASAALTASGVLRSATPSIKSISIT